MSYENLIIHDNMCGKLYRKLHPNLLYRKFHYSSCDSYCHYVSVKITILTLLFQHILRPLHVFICQLLPMKNAFLDY